VLRTSLRGYDRRAVDAFLARCAATLGARAAEFPELSRYARPDGPVPPLDAGDVRDARFDVVLRGYDEGQVDALLERVAAALPDERSRPAWEHPPAEPAETTGTRLALRRTVRGYDTEEVEAFLARCAHSLGASVDRVPELMPLLARPRTGDPLRARDVEVVQFHVRGRGYDIEQVDALLDRIATALTAANR
jgi:DivIVA domain-containing protein